MVSDMHSFAALQCRIGKTAAGRSAKLLSLLRRHQRESHRCHPLSAPNLQSHQQALTQSPPGHHQTHASFHRPHCQPYHNHHTHHNSHTQSLHLNMLACSILRYLVIANQQELTAAGPNHTSAETSYRCPVASVFCMCVCRILVL